MASTSSPNQTVKLTKTVVDRIKAPATGQAFYRDSELKGFALRITANGVKSFVVEKRIEGRVRRETLGRYGELTVEQARKEAQKYLGKIAMGLNPASEKKREQLRTLTLEQIFADFKRMRVGLKPGTVYQYARLLNGTFADWKTRPVSAITKDMIARKHIQLGEKSESSANLAMRFLRGLFNFAMANYEDGYGNAVLSENPVERLTRTRSWYRSKRRQTVIKVHQLPQWHRAVMALRHDPAPVAETVSDYLLFLLYSGLRRQEAAQLTWERIDLEQRALVIPDPKNHMPHTLPLSSPLLEILHRRKEVAHNAFVFCGEGPAGYLIEPKRQMAKVMGASGVTFAIHDLRRTFITIAESIDVSPYTIKRLVNHTMRNDVTAGYIVSDLERLRSPMQKIADFIGKSVLPKPSAPIRSLRVAA